MKRRSLIAELNGFRIGLEPDSSGVRGGLKRDPLSRAGDFPYDKDMGYGTSSGGPFGRGNPKKSELHHGLTPKDTSHSIWDELETEVIGYPVLIGRASQGSADGGPIIPGTGGEWAAFQVEPDYDEDEILSAYGDEHRNSDEIQASLESVWNDLEKLL